MSHNFHKIFGNTIVFNIDNNQNFFLQQNSKLEWFLKNHDTEDWSNDAENSALITEIIFFFIIYSYRKQVIWNCNNISYFYSIFDQINAALESRKDFIQKQQKILPTPNFYASNAMAFIQASTKDWPSAHISTRFH